MFDLNIIRSLSRKCVSLLLMTTILIISFQSNSWSVDQKGANRIRYCGSDGEPAHGFSGTLDPLGNMQQTKEYEFSLNNSHCLGILAGFAAVRLLVIAAGKACDVYSAGTSPYPNLLLDVMGFSKMSKKVSNKACGAAYTVALASYTSYILGTLGIQYERAKNFYNATRVCGDLWNQIDYNTESPNYLNYSVGSYKSYVEKEIKKIDCRNTNSDYEKRICNEYSYSGMEYEDNPSNGEDPCLDPRSIDDKGSYSRQKYYLRGLMSGTFNCHFYNPARVSSDVRKDFQKAYACCKKRSREYMCLYYSKCNAGESNCSDTRKSSVFCKAGNKCSLEHGGDNVVIETERVTSNVICAKTYNFCPFNFSIGGGSDECIMAKDAELDMKAWENSIVKWKYPNLEDYPIIDQDIDEAADKNFTNSTAISASNLPGERDSCSKSYIRNIDCTLNARAGKCINSCQYLQGCTTVTLGNDYSEQNASPYMSEACINFIGDSRNIQSFDSGFVAGKLRNFSAPIAQCVKETIENLFYNRVGHSKCQSSSESPTTDRGCDSGYKILDPTNGLIFKKGTKAKEKSFFENIQRIMQDFVKAALVLSIVFYGVAILAGMKSATSKKDIVVYISKIGIIAYFALGSAWQAVFFDGIYNASTYLAAGLTKFTASKNEELRDGCQFGIVTFEDGTTEYAASYPDGKYYLAMWDTLDCKIARYLGFGPNVSVASIASIILAGYFTGPVGIYFSVAILFFGVFLVVITIKALHIFLGSAVSIILMVFVSPVIFLSLLFDKTKNIFTKWLTNLIGFALQPVILFAYIFIVVTMMDKVLIGSATFKTMSKNQNAAKSLDCEEYCISSYDGSLVKKSENGYEDCIVDYFSKKINPYTDSVACLVNFDDFGTMPGLEIIGLSIPILDNLLTGKGSVSVGAKIITLLNAALVMYLLNKFISEIPGIASALTGSSSLPGANIETSSVLNKTAGILSAIQKRATRAAHKAGKSGADAAKKQGSQNRKNATVASGQSYSSSSSDS